MPAGLRHNKRQAAAGVLPLKFAYSTVESDSIRNEVDVFAPKGELKNCSGSEGNKLEMRRPIGLHGRIPG